MLKYLNKYKNLEVAILGKKVFGVSQDKAKLKITLKNEV